MLIKRKLESNPSFHLFHSVAAPSISYHSSFFFLILYSFCNTICSCLFKICLCFVHSYGWGVFASSFSCAHHLICSLLDWGHRSSEFGSFSWTAGTQWTTSFPGSVPVQRFSIRFFGRTIIGVVRTGWTGRSGPVRF